MILINKIVFGLLNPLEDWIGTNHNVGGELVQFFGKFKVKSGLNVNYFVLNSTIFCWSNKKCINESGLILLYLLSKYDCVSEIMLLYDDIDIQLGQVKLKKGIPRSTHNGIRSINKELKSANISEITFYTLKIGINNNSSVDLADFVYEKINLPSESLLKVQTFLFFFSLDS